MSNVSIGTVGPNFTCVDVGGVTIYFSYKTPIAFHNANGLTIRVNDWSTTTGKHLNAIDPNKTRRVSGKVFEARLELATAHLS